jgi:nicotinate-nucleotide pyrophosphorylase (carboxylating)
VATRTAQYVAAVEAAVQPAVGERLAAGTAPRIVDTRKTLPGLRLAQKYAVAAGRWPEPPAGPVRRGADQGEPHCRRRRRHGGAATREGHCAAGARFVQIEVETLAQLQEALQAGAHMVLLDNMDIWTP